MTDHELRDLLHERVADLSTADLSGAAWARATRIRRRRAAGVVAGAVASVAVVAVALAGIPGFDRAIGPVPATNLPSPGRDASKAALAPDRLPGAADTQPDGHYRGWPVYWGPSASQEETLPRVESPFPDEVDLSAPAPDLAEDPIDRALAAYALVDEDGGRRLLLLAPDGSLRSVDVSRVAPFDDGSGFDFSLAHETLLSPTGEHLAFPQRTSVLVLTLATGRWRTIDAGDTTTAGIHWLGNTDIWLPPTTQGGEGPLFSALTGQRSGATNMRAPRGPFDAGGPYGRWRMGPGGEAQSWTRVPGLPVPRGAVTPSQVLLDSGNGPASRALLVYGSSSSSPDAVRPETCCGVQFWLEDDTVAYETYAGPRRLVAWKVGTHGLGLVTRIVGYDADRETLVSSYARIWDR